MLYLKLAISVNILDYFGLFSVNWNKMRTTPREVCSLLVKDRFQLSDIQKDVLVGTLLGDGNLSYRGRNCRLHIKHSLNQLVLVDYKRKVFEDITSMKVRKFTQAVGEKDYNFAEFVTLTHPEFSKYHNLFYPSGKKSIPRDIDKLLITPLSLAVWFMDDGAADYAGASLQTHSFTEEDVVRLMKVLKLNFEIYTTKRLNKGSWIIYFPKASMKRLRQLIGVHMLEEFKYKLIPYSIR